MSLQTDETIIWYGFYSADGVGEIGLADVVIYIYKDNSATPEVDGLACTELARGFYYYIQVSPTAGFRVAVMVTADTTVDQKEIPAIRDTGKGGCDYLDASVDTVDGVVDGIDTVVDSIETKVDNLDADLVVVDGIVDTINTNVITIDGHIDSIITTLSTLIADIWGYVTRKLTSAWTDEASPRDMAAIASGISVQQSNAVSVGLDNATLYLKTNDTEPTTIVLYDSNGSKKNLTSSTVVFSMSLRNSALNKVEGRSCTITDATNGTLTIDWQAGDLDTEGIYDGEFKITSSSSKVQHGPSYQYLEIIVTESLY